jgi:rare lipoprotein A
MKKLIFVLIVMMIGIAICKIEVGRADSTASAFDSISYTVASWYGPNFHGKRTASGQIFDMHDFTCAHKRFPFGSWLKITNLLNDKTTVCMVNDRGPFKALRDLDLSYAAAKVIDLITLGQCMVKIELLGMDNEYFEAVRDIFKRE